MKRGEIYYANLDPTVGSEIKKKRPVLIISNNANNRMATTITVLPITSKITHIYPFEVALSAKISGLKKDSKIQCQQIRTISKLRINSSAIGIVTQAVLHHVQAALELHLDFN
ncbi:MAG: type II toxin-antitoxin system PemK/MazF family toxin [Gammaproteobacteria bacterium]|nr:type II toxin-antitoxin system PemK/MazF family toxin [Gammaproteobacteria bacterium]